jgi:hypothetical protein
MTSLVSLVCAVYRKEPARIYYAGRNTQGTALFEHTKEAEIESSQEEGFRNNRAFFGEQMNRLVRLMDPDLRFEWSGLEVEDHEAQLRIETQEVQHFKAIDEIRLQKGEKPYKEWWSQVPLNPLVFQAVQAEKQDALSASQPGVLPEEDEEYGDIPPAILARLRAAAGPQQDARPAPQRRGGVNRFVPAGAEDDEEQGLTKSLDTWEEIII